MHWTERRRAVARIGEELQRRGWILYGYHEDRSEPLTDYYAPATWDGVATKEGAVACVSVDAYTARRAGQDIVEHKGVPGEPCTHCQGTGVWPGGLTYEEARVYPAGQHFILYCAERGSRPGHPDVVSPLHYHGLAGEAVNPQASSGAPKCLYCAGRGYKVKQKSTVVGQWPVFRANPKGKTWHVERDGRLVGSGVGLQACAHWDSARTADAVRALCDRIEAAVFPRPRVTLDASPHREQATIAAGIVEGDIPFTVYEEGSWTWIAFGAKPSADLRGRLKRAGGHWRRQRGAWSFRYTGVDLAVLGLGGQSADTPDPAAESAQRDKVAAPLVQGGGPAQQDADTAALRVPDSAMAQQDAATALPPVQGDETAQQNTSATAPPASDSTIAQQGTAALPAGGDAGPDPTWQVPDLPAEFARHAPAVHLLVRKMVTHRALIAYVQANPRDNARLAFDRILADLLTGLADRHLDAYAVLAEPPSRGRFLDWLFAWFYSWAKDRTDASSAEPAQDAGDYRLAQLRCPNCGLEYHGMVGSRTAVPAPARCPRCGAVGEEPNPTGGPANEPESVSPAPPAAADNQTGSAPPHQPVAI